LQIISYLSSADEAIDVCDENFSNL
jgi:hypothetical protein